MISRRAFLSAGAAAAQGPGRRPNILFLMTDEHRFDAVGWRNPAVKTPHLDRLAGESIVFDRAYSTSPSCVPARAAIYTGRYPSQCGAPAFITYLPKQEVTFMSLLQEAGYYTAAIGKQHFGDTEIRRGYDYEDLVDGEGGGSSYTRALRAAGVQLKQLRQPAGRFVSRWQGDQKHHIDDFVGEQALRWITGQRPTAKPWFLTVSFHGPHQPFDGLGLDTEKLYRLDQIDLPETGSQHLDGKPPHFRAIEKSSGGLTRDEIRLARLSYYAKISAIDRKIGALLDALRASGEYDDTLIVFTADHGDYMGDYGLIYKAQYLSEALMRVPLLAKPPVAGFKGRRERAFVANFDIGPTCLTLAGRPVPENMAAEDLSKFWRSPDGARRTHAFLDGHHLQGVRDGRWKLVHYRDRPYGELYDLATDPWEKVNRWSDPSVREVRVELQGRLLDHLLRTAPRPGAEWNKGAPRI